ncbi:hypothetical protein FRC02_007127 [Tulasnella sp. 418]|nr:hypothetical protein FRC02_007127 [Tulasnella sp. 418]
MSALSVPKLQVLETRLPFLIPLAEPYPTLRLLSLHHTTLSPLDLFEFLRNSRFTLQNLSLCVVTFDDTNPPSTWIPVVMEALQSLLCRTMRRMSFPRLFHGIEAPRLKQLSVISSNWNPETDLDIPDTWSCPDLEILLWCYTPAEGLRRILAKAPNLHTLHLDWMATDILTEVTNRPQGPVYCPRLANLGCRGIQINDILEIALARRFHSLQTITILQPHINHPANDEQSSEWRNCTQIIREMPEIKLSIDLRGSLLCRHMFQWNLPPDSNLYFPWWLEYDPNPVAEPNQVGIE